MGTEALHVLALFAAGMGAGTINAIAGAGSLLTFPTLLALGYEPVVANVTNTVGIVSGSVSGAYGYRRELVGQAPRVRVLGAAGLAGGITGALLLLVLPPSVFRKIVPVLILVACALVAAQRRIARRMLRRAEAGMLPREHKGPVLVLGVFGTGVYGGYFGAAQGVILIALLGIFINDRLQRLNGLKNVLAALVNGVAAVLFVLSGKVAWGAAVALAAGAVTGGQVGARVGRRVNDTVLRTVIIVVGTVVAVRLLVG